MKVLVASVPALGHLLPLLPLTEALVRQGDAVTVASHSGVASHVEPTGATFCAVGHDEAAWFERLRSRTRGAPGDGLAPSRINQYFVPRVFAEIGADDMVDDLLDVARRLEPDVVLFEPYAFAAPLVARLVEARSVQHLVGPMLGHEVMALADDAVSPLWRSMGLDSPGFAGAYADTTIEICPAGFEVLAVPSGESLSIRPSPLPASRPVRTERPLVYVTLGSFFADVEPIRVVLASLADEPVDVVVTLGAHGDPAVLGEVPANATIEGFVAQAELLPRCSAVVHHCGGGTTFGALAHGLAQVALPQGADNFINAALLERAGAAVSLFGESFSAAAVRASVRRVLDDASFTAAAATIAREIASMPAPEAVAATLRQRFGT